MNTLKHISEYLTTNKVGEEFIERYITPKEYKGVPRIPITDEFKYLLKYLKPGATVFLAPINRPKYEEIWREYVIPNKENIVSLLVQSWLFGRLKFADMDNYTPITYQEMRDKYKWIK